MADDFSASLACVRTLDPDQVRMYLSAASRLALGEDLSGDPNFAFPLRYENGLILGEPPLAAAFVVRFPNTYFSFPGGDPLPARFWFETLLKDRAHAIAFYPSLDLLPRELSPDDFPIQVGTIQVSHRPVTSKWERNPIAGHDYLRLVGSTRGLRIQGWGPTSMKTLRNDLAFVQSLPDAQWSESVRQKHLAADEELTRSFQRSFTRLYTDFLNEPPPAPPARERMR